MIAAVELVVDEAAKKALDPVGRLGGLVVQKMQDEGVIGRAMGDALAFCPPMIITEAQVDDMVAILKASLDAVAADLGL